MSASLSCTRCGYQNQPGYTFCTNCGAPLGAAAGAPAVAPPAAYGAPPGYPSAAGYYPPAGDYDRSRQVDRTKTGVLLLLIGTLLSWLPLISIIGYLLIFIGVILVILGRKAFGAAHSRNILVSIVLFIVGVLVVIGVTVIAALASIAGQFGSGGAVTITPPILAAALNASLLGAIPAAIILGIAEVLFTYGLQAQPGRVILFAAYGANIAVSIAMYLLLSSVVGAVVTQADYDSVVALQGTYALLNVIPALLFAAADYLAWARINRGEIPAHPGGASGAVLTSPYAMPPQSPPPSGPAPPLNPQ